ncbi:DNA/RNA helicase domain-containing protein [Bacillus mycoides]|uniref:DNA/RNA helicase domain-containing protein n=1 Tax=Bacillus mycoides TaxID=1405 RepID=UPI0011A87F36|nr:DNA/RNA helicase domain-containing protein [Bacillus mycoides]
MAKKSINLISLINAKNDLSPETFETYLGKLEGSAKNSELEDITALVERLKAITKKKMIFNHYYVGFTIKQIGKEFDLLRVGLNHHINIELKRENTGERIRKQLIKNKYYLNSLGKEVFSFTYVTSEDKLYFLEKDNSITESNFEFLVEKIASQDVMEIDDLNKLFDPTNYLVSPFNSTERFIENEYFLTQLQESIKGRFHTLNSSSTNKLFAIEGAAGTGKTLLIYDLAKEYINEGKKVAILHCGNLNNGHSKLINNYSWNIIPVKDYRSLLSEQFDLIILDETQRIYKNQLENIIEYAVNNKITCIFSFDPKQCLHDSEIRNNIPEYVYPIVQENFKLTEKIRTNPEISAFIKNLFNLSNRSPQQSYENIEIQYYSHIDEARGYINALRLNGWTTINYTVSRFKWNSLDNIMVQADDNAHTVIGQEFDNVISIVGDSFRYNAEGKLIGDHNSYYHATQMLLQILTRTRKKLCLIIVNNEPLLKECLKILS